MNLTDPAVSHAGSVRFRFVRLALLAYVLVAFGAYVAMSWHWPLIHDMQVIHFVSFLIDRGWAPYRQIWDMNMPGAYLMEGWALHVFGNSDVGWRLWDFTLSGVLISSMAVLARRYDWVAGVVAGVAFALIHGSGGGYRAGERDQVMAVCLVMACAFFAESVRRSLPWLMLPAAWLCFLAAAIKPTLLLAGPVFFALAFLELRRRKVSRGAYTLWFVAGAVLASAIVLWFLMSHGAMAAFVFDLTKVLPHYASTDVMGRKQLLEITLPVPVLLLVLAAGVIRGVGRRAFAPDWEQGLLITGIVFGLISFWGQRKGFDHHRYTLVAFVLLWASLPVSRALWSRMPRLWLLAAASVLFVCVFVVPVSLKKIHGWPSHDLFTETLERDVVQMGPNRLQGKMQCLEIVDGCMTVMFHQQIVPSTGATGDLLLFLPQPSWTVNWARNLVLPRLQAQPPDLIVLTNGVFNGLPSFDKVKNWPAFEEFLDRDYVAVMQREFPEGEPPTSHPGTDPVKTRAYRLYVRRDSELMKSLPSFR